MVGEHLKLMKSSIHYGFEFSLGQSVTVSSFPVIVYTLFGLELGVTFFIGLECSSFNLQNANTSYLWTILRRCPDKLISLVKNQTKLN